MDRNSFTKRHLGPRPEDVTQMLQTIGVDSVDKLIDETIPKPIRLKALPDIGEGLAEADYLAGLRNYAKKNKTYRTFIGQGYYNSITPSVILRNVFENPGWYTAYTPYQAEVAQGRLEALLNFQTVVMDLTGMQIANASLLDEGTAAVEAMAMFHNNRTKEALKDGVNSFFVSELCFPQTIAVLQNRAHSLGIDLVIGDHQKVSFDKPLFGALVQYPAGNGEVFDYESFCRIAHQHNCPVAVASDLLSLALLRAPGTWGADVVVGNSQRFGVPMGYGGPHAAFFATHDEFKRHIPGRIIGVSQDSNGNRAYRMALQTREQHIRRDKATSNICTAQALLAVMASMYAVYHGPDGIRAIAEQCYNNASRLAGALEELGFKRENQYHFDTISIVPAAGQLESIRKAALTAELNFNYSASGTVQISVDETTSEKDLVDIVAAFAAAAGKSAPGINGNRDAIPENMKRKTDYLQHPVFSMYHSESAMMRYLKKLENRDVSLTHSMIPLGSCTMKLNAASELMPLSWPEFAAMHPFLPVDQVEGFQQIIKQLETDLAKITGFAGVSVQPNSGAQGEYAGLAVIRAYHESRGDYHRDLVLIPSSAHGTNPASAVVAGMKVQVVQCDAMGNIDVSDLRTKAAQFKDQLAALMVTYPSTHGVFEEAIMEINEIIHSHGGQVYMDGANMNAQVGLTSPATIGADVCHLNLHKTFAIPHGGGGPGVGPIAVAEHLKPFLPGHPVIKTGGENAIHAVSAAPWGSALILLISYAYIKMLGTSGLVDATRTAILNANYIKSRLEGSYKVLYVGTKGRVAHEMILDCRDFKKNAGIEVADIAKRLIDFGFHAPTVSFPVAGTLMIEPTESEPKEELDRFCDAMLQIRAEIQDIAVGVSDMENNLLRNAPHTAAAVLSDDWSRPYTRKQAAFPLPFVEAAKFWPFVGRIDNALGDRNLICSCPPIAEYMEHNVENQPA